jgi:hypothetical protein
VQRDLVTFWYEGGIQDTDLLSGPAILRYRVSGDIAAREGPAALTRAGFLQEWLNMGDAEAVRWSDPDAAAKHATASAAFAHDTFSWDRIARCDSSQQVWEIGVWLNESKARYIFRLTGSHAAKLRMISIVESPDETCAPLDWRKNLGAIGAELPW